MNITSSKIAEILERKAKYEEDYSAYKKVYDEQEGKYYLAEQSIFDNIKNVINEYLKDCNIQIDVSVSRALFSDYGNGKSVKVTIQSNENRVHAEDKALSWSYSVKIGDEGNFEAKTSSWSGLQATTTEQMESLRQTVKALEILNSIDWNKILTVQLPSYKDYITISNPFHREDKPNFDREILDAQLEFIVGKNMIIKRYGNNHGWVRWCRITKETLKQYTYEYIDIREKDTEDVIKERLEGNWWQERMTKEKFIEDIIRPLEILEL